MILGVGLISTIRFVRDSWANGGDTRGGKGKSQVAMGWRLARGMMCLER